MVGLGFFLSFGVFVLDEGADIGLWVFCIFRFNEYLITCTLCLHIPDQQLVVKFENNLERRTFMLLGPQRNSLLISLNLLAHTLLQKNFYDFQDDIPARL